MLKNSKEWPQVYSCKFLTAGLVSYEDSGAGIALLKKETIDRMLPSFIGKPVIINHQNVTPANFKDVSKGTVIKCWFCPEDGWFYADFIVDSDDAVYCIEEDGYSVSCAYDVKDAAEGGTYQDIKFDGEITEGFFTHLALVKEPRYEESKIMRQSPMMLVNGKQAQGLTKEEFDMNWRIFKKTANGKQEFTGDVVNIDGYGDVPVDHLVQNYADEKAFAADEQKRKEESANKKKNTKYMNSTDIVDINGNKVSIGEMVEKYKVYKNNEKATDEEEAKKNAKEAEDKAKEEEAKKNAKDEEDKKKKDEEDKAKAENEKKEKEEAEAKENEKKEAEAKENAKKAEEEANLKIENDKKAKEEEEAKAKENAKKKGEEYFAELQNAGHKFDAEEGAPSKPMTRTERAAAWAVRNTKKQ